MSCRIRQGLGRVELLVGIACLVIVLVVVIALLGMRRGESVWQHDAHAVKHIHQSMLVFAGEHNGVMPRPGLVATSGDGSEDRRHNNTAAMYSLMVMRNYVSPQSLISHTEPNPNVTAHDEYNYDAYDPAAGRYWDRTFHADLDRIAHVSFAHVFMFGERFERYWRETLDSRVPVIGNRGPAEGVRDRYSYTTDDHGRWSGWVVGGDNATHMLRTMTPAWLTFGGDEDDPGKPDNLFAVDDTLHGIDVVLTYTRNSDRMSAELHHD